MRIAITTLLLAATLSACGEDPCQEYVDYMCECHDGDDGLSCSDLQSQYESPSADLQDECVIALDEQEASDQESGVCDADTGA